MAISLLSFRLTVEKENVALREELLQQVRKHQMAPYYREVCNYFGYNLDTNLYQEMKEANRKVIKESKDVINEKRLNGSEDDVLDLLLTLVRAIFLIHL